MKPYRKEGEQVALQIVEPEILRCEECQHCVEIIASGPYGSSFDHLACHVRALETLQPHESPRKFRNQWYNWDCKKWNEKGDCERWEAPEKRSWIDRVLLWWLNG